MAVQDSGGEGRFAQRLLKREKGKGFPILQGTAAAICSKHTFLQESPLQETPCSCRAVTDLDYAVLTADGIPSPSQGTETLVVRGGLGGVGGE
eukprot:1157988-Pelagomonas_calceolata.AAC.1